MVPAPFVVVLDANVLYPFTLRDTLLRAAAAGFYQLRWTARILEEMTRSLERSANMPAAKAQHLREIMEREFPEAEVTGYDDLIAAMTNDEKDRHVVAAAVKAGAQVITTSNLKHFKNLPEGIEAQSPDEFLCNLLDLSKEGMIALLRDQASDLVNPPMTFEALVDRLARVAPDFAHAVRQRGALA